MGRACSNLFPNPNSRNRNRKYSRAAARGEGRYLHEKMSAAAAPRKPKKGAVSSPLNADISLLLLLPLLTPLPLVLRRETDAWGALVPRPPSRGLRRHERSRFRSSAWDLGFRRSDLRSSWVGWGRGEERREGHGACARWEWGDL